MTIALGSFRLPVILLSPAALLALGPALLADGTRGPWAAVALAGGAVLVALVLTGPWSRPVPPGVVEVATTRWSSSGPGLIPVALAERLAALLFVWAQLAALRELAAVAGWWPRTTVMLAAAGLVAAAWREVPRWRLVDAGAALLAAGLVIPLLAVVAVTTPVWPRVWAAVAARPRLSFAEGGVWTREGGPVRAGGAADATLTFTEEERVTVFGPGPIRLFPWEGRDGSRDLPADTEVVLRAGDRLTVMGGTRVRFQAGRRIPGAPTSGADWVSPRGPTPDGGALAGLALTLALGALGLPAIAVGLGAGARAARAGAGLVLPGAALTLLWALYAAWVTPEVYAGGVAGPEVYELSARVDALRPVGGPLRLLALAGLMAGGLAAALAALGGVSRRLPGRSGGSRTPVVVAGLAGGTLAALSAAGPWVPLVMAFGLGASALAPAATLARWSERVTPRSLGAGAGVGLAAFSVLTLVGLWARVGPGQLLAPGPAGLILAWPALVGLPANALVAWLRMAPVGVSPRSPLPGGLAELHDEEPLRLQASGGSATMILGGMIRN